MKPRDRISSGARKHLLATVMAIAGLCVGATAIAQTAAGGGPAWSELSAAQRGALAPLGADWSSFSADRKQKWIDVAGRFPSMTADERTRVQARMGEWSRLSPDEKGRARLNFQESRQLPAQERQARWEAYQALPPEKRRELGERAAPPVPPAPRSGPERTAARLDMQEGKSNIVGGNNAVPPPPRAGSPSTVQEARPGATTTLISRPANPPAHQQPGLPKIAASPGFVDRSTLLPQRGPQGAAITAAQPQTGGGAGASAKPPKSNTDK